MKRTILSFLILFLFAGTTAFAQLRNVPAEVTTAFTKQYPEAQSVTYKDNLVHFTVHFTLNNEQIIAKYDSNGQWKESEKTTELAHLPQAVTEGFQKSKYANWKVQEIIVLTQPQGVESYRLKVEKNDLQKKNLYFNKEGRLTKDGITL